MRDSEWQPGGAVCRGDQDGNGCPLLKQKLSWITLYYRSCGTVIGPAALWSLMGAYSARTEPGMKKPWLRLSGHLLVWGPLGSAESSSARLFGIHMKKVVLKIYWFLANHGGLPLKLSVIIFILSCACHCFFLYTFVLC